MIIVQSTENKLQNRNINDCLYGKINILDPNDPKDGAIDSDGDGYTNVEEYLNSTNPQENINYHNLGNNVDTIS